MYEKTHKPLISIEVTVNPCEEVQTRESINNSINGAVGLFMALYTARMG